MFRTRHISSSAQYQIQTVIIGAGIIGLSVARALACRKSHEVLIVEQSDSIGSGISSRNSEVIHAGIYYDRNIMPLKSKFCVDGKKMIYDYCRERNIPNKQCGKLIVATDMDQKNIGLPRLVENARKNGVHDLRILSKEEVFDMEPNVLSEGAVFSPSTGIVDSHALMTSFLADAEECGATLALNCKVEGGRIIPKSSTTDRSEDKIILNIDGTEMECENVIICAGLASHKIASDILSSRRALNLNNPEIKSNDQSKSFIPRQYYAKGNYFKLENQKSPFTRLIYPMPDPSGGLGVHATIDLAGTTRFGPDVEWLPLDASNNPEKCDMKVEASRSKVFYNAIKAYWPDLNEQNLVPDYSGIRPKLVHPHLHKFNTDGLNDFVIAGKEHHGIESFVVLLGIESPGLTSCLAIGNHVEMPFK